MTYRESVNVYLNYLPTWDFVKLCYTMDTISCGMIDNDSNNPTAGFMTAISTVKMTKDKY